MRGANNGTENILPFHGHGGIAGTRLSRSRNFLRRFVRKFI